MTTARYYTPNDINIDKTGIDPDIFVTPKEFSEQEFESYKRVVEEDLIGSFVREYPSPSENRINYFLGELVKEKIELDEYYLKMMIQNEINRRMDNPPVYNLEYDETLKKAVEILED